MKCFSCLRKGVVLALFVLLLGLSACGKQPEVVSPSPEPSSPEESSSLPLPIVPEPDPEPVYISPTTGREFSKQREFYPILVMIENSRDARPADRAHAGGCRV